MKKVALLMFIATLLSGCFVHIRESSTSLDPSYIAGAYVKTKYKYRVVNSLPFVEKDVEKLNLLLVSYQPDVFALDGIPVVLKDYKLSNDNLAGHISKNNFLVSFITLSIIPGHTSNFNSARSFTLKTNEGEIEPFVINGLREEAISYLPSVYLFSGLVWDSLEGDWETSTDSMCFGYPDSKAVLPRRSFAYALATRLKEAEDSGLDVTKIFKVNEVPRYETEVWRKSSNVHSFVLSLIGYQAKIDERTLELIKKDFAEKVADSYLSDHPSERINDVRVAFKSYGVSKGKIVGTAQAFSIKLELESSYYDSYTRKGRVAFRVRKAQYESARVWARSHIEELARDKNIKLTGASIPSAAQFYLGSEKYENGILEMEYIIE